MTPAGSAHAPGVLACDAGGGRDERGFALLIVLWAMVLLALLGFTITSAGRSEARIAANLLASANAQAAADAAVAACAFHLLDNSDRHWQPDGRVRKLQIGASTVTLTIDDQRGRVDPNDATAGLMAALLRQLGVPDDQASGIAAAVLSWRVANDAADASAYEAQGREFGPPHEPFESIDELGLVAGITPVILAAVRPHLSLYIAQTPNLAAADPVVSKAIDDAVRRGQLTINEDQDPGPAVVMVNAVARNQGARFTRHALLRMNGLASQPYEILDWTGE